MTDKVSLSPGGTWDSTKNQDGNLIRANYLLDSSNLSDHGPVRVPNSKRQGEERR